ncbi:C2H2 type zinc finger domain [Pyrenophora seminiperda CCB06]|uniref:C2H2 type zinc finger domain n=1 Tax=Pyrenophora seminiperda CCB06 TaxID=1302712 RepID=A0A3M7MKM1_9PLEO|nr:C2H2 type zinc finger domain [Pyrenophora seminiperda CCB06]
MAPIIVHAWSTGSLAAPSYTKRALTSNNDVPLAIGLTISFVGFVVILGAVWCLWRRRRLRANMPEAIGSAATERCPSPVEISSTPTETVYKYERDYPSYYSPLSPVAPQELDSGRPGNEISPRIASSSVLNSSPRYTLPNAELPALEEISPFIKEYSFTEPDRRSHPSNTGFDSASTRSGKLPKKQDINIQLNFVNPRDVEYRPNRILQPEEHALFLSLTSLPPRSWPATIHSKPPLYLGMDVPNTDTVNKQGIRNSPSPQSDHSSVPRISTPRGKLANARGLQELHPLSVIDVTGYAREEATQNQKKRPNQRILTTATSSSSHTRYTTTPPSHSEESTPTSANIDTSPASSITPSFSSPATTTATTQSPVSPFTDTEKPIFKCPDCRQTFRTPGLRRNHHNRRHNLRYTCIICTAPFGLRADLERHQFARHPEHFRAADRFWCTIVGCENPGKEWSRKDNFERHVKRCEARSAKRRGKERAVV